MAADAKRALTIKFSATGEKKLVDAINALAKAQNRLNSSTKKVAKGQHLVNKRVTKNTKAVGKLQSAISVYRNKMLLASFAITFVSKALVSFVEKAGKQEDSVIRLAQVFGGEAAQSLDKYSSELQKNSTFGDENINMIMSQIGAFGASVEETKLLTQATIDLAAGMNIDLNTAGLLVAKTIGSTTDALTRYGVGADGATEQSEKIANIVESVEEKFGGLAKTLSQTTSGQLQQASMAFGDFQENLGQVLAPVVLLAAKAFKALSEAMNPRVISAMILATTAYLVVITAFRVQTSMATAGTILHTLAQGGLTKALKQARKAQIALMATMKRSLWGLLAAAIAGVVIYLIDFSKWLGLSQDELDKYGRTIMTAAEADKELLKSIGDNIDALQEELDLLNADNDMHRMAIRLKREETNFTYGLVTAEIALFEALKLRKEEVTLLEKLEQAYNKTNKAQLERLKIQLLDAQYLFMTGQLTKEQIEGMDGLVKEIEKLEKGTSKKVSSENALLDAYNKTTAARIRVIEAIIAEAQAKALSVGLTGEELSGLIALIETLNKLKDTYKETKDEVISWVEVMQAWVDAIAPMFELISEMFSQQLENIREHIVEIDEFANAEIAIIRSVAKETLAEEKKTRRWQRMTAQGQAAYEKKIMEKAAKSEAAINAQREKDKEIARQKGNKLLLKQFRLEQAMKIAQAVINTATAYTAALPIPPIPFFAGFVAALGAAQIALIAAQKPPTMAQGGLVGGNLHSQGGTMIEAERGEFVMSRGTVDAIGVETMNRINEGGGGSINITFTGNVLSGEFVEEEVIPQIRDSLRRGVDIGLG